MKLLEDLYIYINDEFPHGLFEMDFQNGVISINFAFFLPKTTHIFATKILAMACCHPSFLALGWHTFFGDST